MANICNIHNSEAKFVRWSKSFGCFDKSWKGKEMFTVRWTKLREARNFFGRLDTHGSTISMKFLSWTEILLYF